MLNQPEKVITDPLKITSSAPIPFIKAVHELVHSKDGRNWSLIEPSAESQARLFKRLYSSEVLSPDSCKMNACEFITLGPFCKSEAKAGAKRNDVFDELAAHAEASKQHGAKAVSLVMTYLEQERCVQAVHAR